MKYEIMYIEEKSGVASLEAHIGQVFLSKTGKAMDTKLIISTLKQKNIIGSQSAEKMATMHFTKPKCLLMKKFGKSIGLP